MIVSHRHRFIFLRTEKTAGTSLFEALLSLLGPEDLVADMARPAWARYSPIHHGALKRTIPDLFGLHVHATAAQARRVLGRRVFDGYFKFAVERNPWDRQLSLYHHRCWKTGRTPNFEADMASRWYRNTEYCRLNNWAMYAIGNSVVADRVLRYETLGGELERLWAVLGVTPPDMPRRRAEYRAARPHYSHAYGPASRALVARWYGREIAALGYRFETGPAAGADGTPPNPHDPAAPFAAFDDA
ncbi:MAG: sulfotransferase family 2 domain-containing protein [Pseudomonadota bacterium]